MQKITGATLIFLLLFMFSGQSFAQGPQFYNEVITEYYQKPLEACKKGFNLPKVHTLPTGVGKVSVKKCFHNGFQTIYPETRKIGECMIAAKTQGIINNGNIAYKENCNMLYICDNINCRSVGFKPDCCCNKINCKAGSEALKGKPKCCPITVKIVRRKYFCRFKGAGAVLGKTGEVRQEGSKMFFRGEEPRNFTTKDPNCKKIFAELFTKDNKYCYLK